MINNCTKAQSVGEGSERRVLGGVLVAVGGPQNADIEHRSLPVILKGIKWARGEKKKPICIMHLLFRPLA